MKTAFTRFVMTMLLLMVSVATWAYDVEVDGIYYNLDKTTMTATVASKTASYNSYSGDVNIPETFVSDGVTYSVTSIENNAFSDCTGLTSVTIPNSVTSIGYGAFEYCSGLTSVTIPNSVTSIGGSAFYNCSGLTSVTIPNSVTSIGIYAFSSCIGLTSVTIPNSVTSIGDGAFYGCTSLTTLNYNGNIQETSSEYSTYLSYQPVVLQYYPIFPNTLKEVNIGDEVESIPSCFLYGCTGLTSVTIPNSVTSIGREAFCGCTSLISISIPKSVTKIGVCAFYNTPWYKEYSKNEENIYGNIVFIGDVAYESKSSSITSCEFKPTTTYITGSACSGCSALTSVIIPNSVTVIGNSAFSGCTSLSSITIPNSVTVIGNNAFFNCTGLTSLTIPNSVIGIGCEAFNGCKSLTLLTIPNSVSIISYNAFNNCTGLTSVTIPNSVTSIGESAFHGCSGLTSVTIPNSVTSIGKDAFRGCTSLTSVTTPNSVTSIGDCAFEGCAGLTSVTIPNSLTSIGSNAFYGCHLRTIISKREIPFNTVIFSDTTCMHAQLYVPEGSYWDYAYSAWYKFNNIKEFAASEDNVRDGAVYMIADEAGMNYKVYNARTNVISNVEYTFALDDEDEGTCWQVIENSSDKYLYNIGAKAYAALNDKGEIELSTTPTALEINVTETGTTINGYNKMLVVNGNVQPVTPTGITTVASSNQPCAPTYYNLSGRRFSTPQKGLNVVNGKKIIL